ncbi:hypothetical protein K461DRAFT_43311 [Myriangium duriaei CBS 260.36]|uniref:Uncharacterized protein n=1 Tax=Myriangium duriaei CBS 260.36 TaxID=1168546 RepID=A0A9P4ISK5_9PEZI|nr:hypothetical protein K461DRAFT_43311 [Myriangium duriaei CBS 260.36]
MGAAPSSFSEPWGFVLIRTTTKTSAQQSTQELCWNLALSKLKQHVEYGSHPRMDPNGEIKRWVTSKFTLITIDEDEGANDKVVRTRFREWLDSNPDYDGICRHACLVLNDANVAALVNAPDPLPGYVMSAGSWDQAYVRILDADYDEGTAKKQRYRSWMRVRAAFLWEVFSRLRDTGSMLKLTPSIEVHGQIPIYNSIATAV